MRKSLNPMSLTKKLSIQLASRLAVYGFFWGQAYSEKRFKVTYSEPELKK